MAEEALKNSEYLRKNLGEVLARIEYAKTNAAREDDILLLPAVKYASSEEIDELFRLGIREVGENRVNTFLEHYEGVRARDDIGWHFIGGLQKNKVKYLVGKIKLLHSLDSLSLAEEIEKRYARAGLTLDCLVEINIGREESKGGVLPEEVSDFVKALCAFECINLRGFMTMAPATSTEEEFSRYFGEAIRLGNEAWRDRKLPGSPIYSIGMSRTLSAAIEAGSNIVRVGSDIFGHK